MDARKKKRLAAAGWRVGTTTEFLALVFVTGFATVKAELNGIFAPRIPVPYLDGIIQRIPPVVASVQSEPAVYTFNILSATGTAIFIAAILGLAFAQTGVLYPIFGTMLGWLGVALTGSDTSSNVLFGSLQKITATQLGLSPVLMAAANSSGGVMGKMIDAQSIVVASTATRYYGHEGKILRFVFWHSIALALLVSLLVLLQAYVAPFTAMVPR